MNRKLIIFLVLLIVAPAAWAGDPKFKSGATPNVDGVHSSTSVIVSGRQPVFSWEYASFVASFTIKVEDADRIRTYWDYVGSTNTTNTINLITRIPYNTDSKAVFPLLPGKMYSWTVTLYDGTSVSATDEFSTVSSVVALPESKLNLEIDWNNPFDPSKKQITKFVFAAKDRDRKVRVGVYTLSGALVRLWSEQTALKDAWYTIDWDGKNMDGEVVARGIYIVSLIDVIDNAGITRKVAVVKDK